jgi:hypothetical protein
MSDWPALKRWTPQYLASRIGSREIEFQTGRNGNPRFEREKHIHRQSAPFDEFIDRISKAGADNDAYLTAFNSERNQEALSRLADDMGFLDKVLDRHSPGARGMPWIGPAGTFTPLHHDLTNNLIAQLVGRKQVKLLPAGEVGRLANDDHVFSDIEDVDAADLVRNPRLAGARVYDLTLAPGETLFVPFAWWHQVRSLDFSVTVTFTNFHWLNDAYATYPTG